MNHAVLNTLWILADEVPRDTGPDFGKASPFGLLVIVLLLLGTFGLVWSMNRQLKKVPESFDPQDPAADQAADEGTLDPGPDSTG
ncbi:hypothetical protein [Mycolicibacter kumamotonensis]|jgi:hypothetical protein|uniref:Uncharacterized protein n=1 Tax=Mycolicibacter kumamotonensis TaxID=354243 RepID=A0A1B8S9T2_9MYCO|nr:hypothetical protein [Mycolicibacter kumamotonensis]NDJ90171.1 hypothetical protein [Mycolicibacter kumamotonensis]OBY29487.1 hypothetical protein ACT18_22745 [Mycolicibacter kumamotonensis]ORA76748.1 hypothetical protein BST28_20440 [Mycolicibacter kumamotonensis]